MKLTSPVLMLGLLALAACSQEPAEPEVQATDTPAAEAPSEVATADPVASEAPASETAVAQDAIPEGLRGRWGLVPADCTSTKGDAKGLMTVAADNLKFYESVAKLGAVKSATAQAIEAGYTFTGEGQTWNLDVTLTLGADGKTLVRRDRGPDAMPEPLSYTRCAT